MVFYNMGSGILRAVSDSKTPLYYLVFSSVVYIILDLIVVINFKIGIAGVAWAILIAQSLSAILVLIRLVRSKDFYRFN